MGKLNGDLYDRDNREYFRASLSLFMEEEGGIGEIPAAAYQTFLLLLEHYVDFKMWKRYDEHLGQTVTISYKLATNETWDELESSQVSNVDRGGRPAGASAPAEARASRPSKCGECRLVIPLGSHVASLAPALGLLVLEARALRPLVR